MTKQLYEQPPEQVQEEVFADNGEPQSAEDAPFDQINLKLDAILAALNVRQEEQR